MHLYVCICIYRILFQLLDIKVIEESDFESASKIKPPNWTELVEEYLKEHRCDPSKPPAW